MSTTILEAVKALISTFPQEEQNQIRLQYAVDADTDEIDFIIIRPFDAD